MTTIHRGARAAVLGLICAATLTGCLPEAQPIQVSLNNTTPSEVTALVVLEQPGEPIHTVQRASLAAGEVATLGPFAPPRDGRLQLVLEREDQFADVPLRRALTPGSSSWRIVTPVFSTYSSIELRDELPAESEWEWAPRGLQRTEGGSASPAVGGNF